MFKIESYITPILLNYLAKYVKNIRPQDFQMSLWEGEVTFQNLDLRLDVLEKELDIPFEILSGHIHELNLQVPWTKITSEPIRISINTIEFILKYKGRRNENDAKAESQKSPTHNNDGAAAASTKPVKKDEENSHMGTGLAMRIVNNISVRCENIIFKYIEEDIVLSMNIQLLNFSSANEQWQPHVEDINVNRVVSRKLVSISDLTICLDKRNAAGQIDCCQEPLLYRCTLECRVLRTYNVQTVATSSTMRVGIFTKALDLNLSSMQLPMLMRLIKTIMSLSGSDHKVKEFKVPCEEFAENSGPVTTNVTGTSLLSWAWSFVPNFYSYSDEEDDRNNARGHIKDIGVYIEELNFTLKNAEFVNDAMVGSVKRIRYMPIVKFSFGGLYFEQVTVKELNWNNVKMGLSSVYVEPLGYFSTEEDGHHLAIVETEPFTNKQSFIDKSLFDEQCKLADKGWIVTNYEDYRTRITDEYLLYRSPILAVDTVQYCSSLQTGGESDRPTSTVASTNMNSLHKQVRVLATGVVFRYNETFVQVKNVIKEFIESYDYTAYSNAEKGETLDTSQHVTRSPPLITSAESSGVKEDISTTKCAASPKLHPPLVEDYDQLMMGVPLCVFKIDIKRFSTEVYPKTENENSNRSSSRKKKLSNFKKNTLSHLMLRVDHAEGNLSMPMNPDKLIQTTCQLPDKPAQLLTVCYKNVHFALNNVTVNLISPQLHSQHVNKILSVPKIHLNYGTLLQPHYWKKDEVAVGQLDVQCDVIKIEFSTRQLIMCSALLQTSIEYRPDLLTVLNQRIRQPLGKADFIKLHTALAKLNIKQRQYHTFELWNMVLGSLQIDLVLGKQAFQGQRYNVLNTSTRFHNNQNKWLELQVQLPAIVQPGEDKLKMAFGLWMERYNLTFDKHLEDFLNIKDSMQSTEPLMDFELNTTSNNIQPTQPNIAAMISSYERPASSTSIKQSLPQVFGRGRARRSPSQPEESAHSTSERDEKIAVMTTETSHAQLKQADTDWIAQKFKQFNSIVIMIELAQSHLYIARSAERNEKGDFVGEFVHICLPQLVWKSTFAEYITRSSLRLKTQPPLKDANNFNWIIQLHDFDIKIYQHNSWHTILNPCYATFTVAMTQRSRPLTDVERSTHFFQNSKIALIKGGQKAKGQDLSSRSADNVAGSFIGANAEEERKESKSHVFVYCLNLHVDCGIMRIYANNAKGLLDQVDYVMHLAQLLSNENSLHKAKNANCRVKDEVKILTYAEEDAHLKEFLELDTSSNVSSVHVIPETTHLAVLSTFCQWTITKMIVELHAETDQKSKIVVELEDLLFTVDRSEDFSKYTNKVGNFSLHYYELDSNQSWIAYDYLSVRKVMDTSDHPFINIIFTTANLKDFYKRLGLKRKPGVLPNNSISEIVIAMQAVEVIVDLDHIPQFVQPLCMFFKKTSNKSCAKGRACHSEGTTTAAAKATTAADLPLLHFESKGITFYFPLENAIDRCTVLICKIDRINVTSSLKNPLQRSPLRPQVFAKATSLGMLTLPGSLIEDRQYELTLQHISAASGKWSDIVKHMQGKVKVVHANPAVEWNNPERKPDLKFNGIFKNFTFIAIYAPNIVYNNIVICGAATEFNCASDFVATIDTDQLNMLGCHARRLQQIVELAELSCDDIPPTPPLHKTSRSETSVYITPHGSMASLRPIKSVNNLPRYPAPVVEVKRLSQPMSSSFQFELIDETSEGLIKTDSGIHSHSLESQKCTITGKDRFGSLASSAGSASLLENNMSDTHTATTLERHIPCTVSLVAGVFIIKILDSSSFKNDDMFAPLISCTISQPSFIFTQNIFDSSMKFSIFNIGLYLPDIGAQQERTPKSNLFPIALIDTMIGKPESTGIPPSLFSYKLTCTKLQRREIDIDFGRPIVFTLNESYTAQLCTNLLTIYNSFKFYTCLTIHPDIPIIRKTKIKLIKKKTLDADRLFLKLNTVMIKFIDADEYHCKLVLCDLSLHLKYLNKPEKCLSRLGVGAFYIRTRHKMFLHPVSLKASLDLVSEPWQQLPMITCIMKFNVIQVDVGIYAVLQLRKCFEALQRIIDYTNNEWQSFQNRFAFRGPQNVRRDNLKLMKCPSSETFIKSTKYSEREEYYQDDLRAGAFQFVELTTDAMLPLPYQIQIIKKDYGIICWRYPQPRRMVKIYVNPIPMASETTVLIKCRMEYFSEAHEQFVHYCDFWLSETVSKNIELPERIVCAYIWRVVILQPLVSVDGNCFDGSEEDEELQSINSARLGEVLNNEAMGKHFILHPKVLVGCMRVDTTFQIQNVPKFQLMIRCNQIHLRLLNQPDENVALPPLLKKFRITKTVKSQAFMVVAFQNISIHGCFYSKNRFQVDAHVSGSIKCLDYGYLNMLPLIEETTLWCYLELDKDKGVIINNMVCDRLRLNMGPAIIHALLSSKNHWEELLDMDDRRVRHALIPKCIIINRTMSLIAFGQTGTKERVHLGVKECSLYSFGSDYHKQELTFYITNEETNTVIASPSVYVPLKFEEKCIFRNLRVGDKCLILRLCKLTNYQIYILIKGQIEFLSMVPHNLRVGFRFGEQKQNSAIEEKRYADYSLDKYGRSSLFMMVQKNSEICIRLKLAENKSRGYTGEIPLRVNRKLPWLVKVPFGATEFISFWVRILRDDIAELCVNTFHPQKILIIVWPIYEVLSLLSGPLQLKEPNNEEVFEVPAENGKHVLDVPATHLSEHDIHFTFSSPVRDQTQTHFNLNLKTLDWQHFFWYDETKWTVDNALQLLAKPLTRQWPFNDEDESRVQRISTNTSKIDVTYNLNQSREFSCTLALQVASWGVFVNAAGIKLQLSDLKSQHLATIESNGLEMLSEISAGFHIEIPNGPTWKSSPPIYFENLQYSTTTNEYYVLSESEPCDILITLEDDIFRFVLTLTMQDNRRVFKLSSKFAAVNFTKTRLCLLPFAMNCKEGTNQAKMQLLERDVPKVDVKAVSSWETCVGISLPQFRDIYAHTSNHRQQQHDLMTSYVYFISIKTCVEGHISIPIRLDQPFKRRCLSIQNGTTPVALVVTVSEKNSIIYLSIAEDICPALLIMNETECPFMIAQTSAPECSATVTVAREYDEHHLQWYHKVPQQSHSYYTPPCWYANFPDVDTAHCNVTLALWDDDVSAKLVKWSKPLQVDKTHKKFLHIPGHGDVQIIICDKHRVVRLSILYVSQQMEFSVKDLRSRLSTTDSISEQLNTAPTLPHSTIAPHSSAAVCSHFRNDCTASTQIRFRLFIKEILCSLHVDSSETQYLKSDVFSLYVDDFVMAYDHETNDDNRELNVLIPNLQIDNQLFSTGRFDFPVVLCSEELYEKTTYKPKAYYLDQTCTCLKQGSIMLDVKVNFYEDEFKIHSIKCHLSPIRAYVEDAYITDLLDALVECDPTNCVYKPKLEYERRVLAENQMIIPHDVVVAALHLMEPLHVRSFIIDPMYVLLSVHTSVRLYIALDHSPLSFSAYQRQNLLTLPLKLGQSLGMHYLSGAIFGAGWVVGSLEILGSPSGLARSVTMGLRDFISLPVRGLFRGPWGFIIGVTQGSASLFRNVTAGTVNSLTKLAASVARNLDRLSLDSEHIERTESLRRIRPQGFTEGFYQGMTGLGISILGAVGGLAHHTLEAKSTTEVFTGVGKGLVGAVTKPISGAAELLALAGQGMLHTVGFNALPQQRCPSNCRNIAVEPSAYRLWKMLPAQLLSDQILFYNEITVISKEKQKSGHICLTSTLFAILETDWEHLRLAYPIDKVEVEADDNDKTLYYVRPKSERDDFAEVSSYTAERIMTFLQNSTLNITSDSLHTLLQVNAHSNMTLHNTRHQESHDYAFHINEHFGEHILRYLKILNMPHLKN